MGTLIWLGSIAAAALISWWIRHRANEVDDFYEREHDDPPIFDAGSFLGGDRW